ncbi:MAG: DUF2177 family protein [Nanoarchaeota archaeon]
MIKFFCVLLPDRIWIMLISKDFYKTEMENIARFKGTELNVGIIPMAILYLLVVVGTIYFVNPKPGVEIIFNL